MLGGVLMEFEERSISRGCARYNQNGVCSLLHYCGQILEKKGHGLNSSFNITNTQDKELESLL